MRKIGWYAAVGMALAMMTGCTDTYEVVHASGAEREVVSERRLVAVMPFQGASVSSDSGLRAANSMANELNSSGKYMVVKPDVVVAGIGPGVVETIAPEEAGRLLGTPYVMTGKVSEYSLKSETGEQPVVGMTASLVESATGRVVWTGTRSRNGSTAWFQGDNQGLLTSGICGDLVKSLDAHARNYGLDGSARPSSTRSHAMASAGTASVGTATYMTETSTTVVVTDASSYGYASVPAPAVTTTMAATQVEPMVVPASASASRMSLSSQTAIARPVPPVAVREDIDALIREWDAKSPSSVVINETRTVRTAPVTAAPQTVIVAPTTTQGQVEPMRVKVINT